METAGASQAPVRRLDNARLPDHRARLFRAAIAICGSREDAEDLVQETFVRVLRRPRFLRRDDDIAYLLKVMRNTWINIHAARRRRPLTIEFDESIHYVIDPDADPAVSLPEIRALYAAVNQLPPPMREALVAVDVVGFSYRQAAGALSVREGTIMSRLYRARNEVAKQLEQDVVRPA